MEQDMLEAIRKFSGDNNISIIGLDESFGFKCQQCGRCCMNREDIILNPFDIYNGAKHLGITCDEFILNYTHIDLGCNSKIPIVLLRSSKNGFCPLLKFDVKDGGKFKCIIHEAKPGACANHPIGIVYNIDKTTGNCSANYIKVEQCSNSISDEQHTVREWIQPYLDHQDEINIAHKIQHLVTDYFNPKKFWMMTQALRKIAITPPEDATNKDKNKFKEMSETIVKEYVRISIGLGYAEYDINKPFIPQAENNIKQLSEFYQHTKTLYEEVKKALPFDLEEENVKEQEDNNGD